MITNYAKVFDTLVKKTADYVQNAGLQAMVLGISGGIDSTVVAAICHEVFVRTGIPLIGRSLPTKYNKRDEVSTARLVGSAFCNSFNEVPIKGIYDTFQAVVMTNEGISTPLSRGNIQARLRMIYLYNLAGIMRGLVMDTDNLTENNLGYFTIHGDVGDFNPIGGLWKTEVFELAEWISRTYWEDNIAWLQEENFNKNDVRNLKCKQAIAITKSLALKPTAGLGITSNDLEELGAESYDQVDTILQEILAWKSITLESSHNLKNFLDDQQLLNIPYPIVEAVAKRHFASEFKRKQLPIKITRNEL